MASGVDFRAVFEGAPEPSSRSFTPLGQAGRASGGLQHSERRLRKLVDHSYDSLVLLDQSGKPFYASPSTERVRGYPPDELLRISLLSLIHPDDPHVRVLLMSGYNEQDAIARFVGKAWPASSGSRST